MKKREIVIFILGIFIISNVFMVFGLQTTILGTGNNNPQTSAFHILSDKQGIPTNIYNHFNGDINTAKKLCELTSLYYSDLGFDRAYPTYVTRTDKSFANPAGDYVYIWQDNKWNRVAAAGHKMISTVKCQEIPCTKKTCADYPNQCGTSLSNGCGGTINCANNCPAGKSCNATSNSCYTPANPPKILSSSCSNINLTIMKLYKTNNSHVSLWDDANYLEDICYGQLFPIEPTDSYNSSSHDCNGTTNPSNVVLWLNGTRNSHASTTKSATYNTPVCFGDLGCKSVVTGECDEGETVVVRLSSVSNAHVSNASYLDYPVKICCKKGPISYEGNTLWQNMKGESISSSEKGDTVRLVLNRDEVLGRNVNYDIYKIDGETFLWFFHSDKQVAQFSSIGFATWKTNETGEFYFNASVEGSPDSYISDSLTVEPSDFYSNSMPQISIVKPIEESTFIVKADGVTEDISFEQNSSDEDDLINVYWNFHDGNTTVINNCNNGTNCNTTHRYNSSSTGTRIINATVKEATRSQSEYDLSRIYVYKQGLILFIIIDEPDYKTRTFSPLPITVDASSSHVANCSSSMDACSSGGHTCYTVTDTIDPSNKLYCYKFAESTSKKFNFTWYIDGENKPDVYPTDSSPFTVIFPKGGKHDIKLNIRVDLSKAG